jgi:hypothetical protein
MQERSEGRRKNNARISGNIILNRMHNIQIEIADAALSKLFDLRIAFAVGVHGAEALKQGCLYPGKLEGEAHGSEEGV